MAAKSWGRAVSGPILAVVGLFLLVLQQTIKKEADVAQALKYGAWATLGIAVFMIFVAQYEVWKHEREEREKEVGKNQRPEIKGEAYGFELDRLGMQSQTQDAQGIWSSSAAIIFRICVCNHRPVPTNMIDVRLDGSAVNWPIKFGSCSLPQGTPVAVCLEHGYSKVFLVKSTVEVDSFRLDEIGEMSLEYLGVSVIDGFGGVHPLSLSSDARLYFSQPAPA